MCTYARVRPSIVALLLLIACSQGAGTIAGQKAAGDFVVLGMEPANGGSIYLNDPIAFDFSTDVDLDSANLATMSFQALDVLGTPTTEPMTGTFHVGTRPGDTAPGRRLVFSAHLPTNDALDNGGFKPRRTYLVSLVGGDVHSTSVLRDRHGNALLQPVSMVFRTRDGTTPAQLFRNPKPGGPARSGFEVGSATRLDAAPIGLFGAPPLEVRLHFDQALNPNSANLPVGVDTDPRTRDEARRGRVWLEYKDPVYDAPLDAADFTWIPADVDIEQNDSDGATLVLRPLGVLPNNATVRVIVEPTLEDIAGEANVGAPAYDPLFATFRTEAAPGQQWNCIVEDFFDTRHIDPEAVFPEAQAEIGPGYVRAGFHFEGQSTTREYEPTNIEVVLNTSLTSMTPKNGLPFTVAGGVFQFRNVTIPQGVTVRGAGPNPMVWLCSGKFTVQGTLSVRGGNGARVDGLASANVAKAGGVGACGGGNGGDGTPKRTERDERGASGRGAGQVPEQGGKGGRIACGGPCYQPTQFAGGLPYNSSGGGSGGGGGTLATQGDPGYRLTTPLTTQPNQPPTANTAFQQVLGFGGSGCSGGSGTRTAFLPGGEPGRLVFTDTRSDNDFWGSAIDLNRNLRITGELTVPIGGSGGGGGGDTAAWNSSCTAPLDPSADSSGGGGGGGGGVLIVKALDEITITSTGHIIADGGNGGGGEQAGACGDAGGGGGGAGGMVILMSAKGIRIEAHGNAAQNRFLYGTPPGAVFLGNDYDFAISADGGVCTTGTFGEVNVTAKYPANGQPMMQGVQYDTNPLGGLGGLGIVQLMVPPGADNQDGTNTRLDDHVEFFAPGALATSNATPLGPLAKMQLLAWRGFPNGNGQQVDDGGNPITIGNNDGDIRPAPQLLPAPIQGRSRVRSKWIDTGSSQRRPLAAADAMARALVLANGAEVGPKFEFAGLQTAGSREGYLDYETIDPGHVRLLAPIVFGSTAVTGVDAQATWLGQPAYRVTLATAALPAADRYDGYEAELLDGNTVQNRYRILSHTTSELLVAPSDGIAPTNPNQLRIRARFFEVTTNGADGLGAVYPRPELNPNHVPPTPIANLCIGFAFHQDPSAADPLAGRFPATANDFVHDLADPSLLQWIAQNGTPRYVQWDVLFDLAYDSGTAAVPALQPSTPRPELHFLRLPFRF